MKNQHIYWTTLWDIFETAAASASIKPSQTVKKKKKNGKLRWEVVSKPLPRQQVWTFSKLARQQKLRVYDNLRACKTYILICPGMWICQPTVVAGLHRISSTLTKEKYGSILQRFSILCGLSGFSSRTVTWSRHQSYDRAIWYPHSSHLILAAHIGDIWQVKNTQHPVKS